MSRPSSRPRRSAPAPRRTRVGRVLAGATVAAAALSFALRAEARSQVEIPWPLRDVYSTAIRFIRIDRGCRITDRDPDAAFVTFECESDDGRGNKSTRRGALELIAMEVQSRPGVRAQVTLADDPRYVEVHFLELLERKIRDERGPGLPPLHAPPAHPPDAGP